MWDKGAGIFVRDTDGSAGPVRKGYFRSVVLTVDCRPSVFDPAGNKHVGGDGVFFVRLPRPRRDDGHQAIRPGRAELRRRADRAAAPGLGVRRQRADDHRAGQRQQRAIPRPGRRRRPRHGAVPHAAVRVRHGVRRQRPGLAHVDGKRSAPGSTTTRVHPVRLG